MDLTAFYNEHNIIYFVDALGNETWLYKEVVIARHIAHPGEKTEVYFHWFVNKRELEFPIWKHSIHPLKKKHGKYYAPDGLAYDSPIGDFDEVSEKNIEIFKLALLASVNNIKKKYQVLKGKQTMLKKHHFSVFSEADLIGIVNIDELERIFKKEKKSYRIKLNNGKSYPIMKLTNCIDRKFSNAASDDKYVIIGNEAIHLVELKHFMTVTSFQLSKENVEQLFNIVSSIK